MSPFACSDVLVEVVAGGNVEEEEEVEGIAAAAAAGVVVAAEWVLADHRRAVPMRRSLAAEEDSDGDALSSRPVDGRCWVEAGLCSDRDVLGCAETHGHWVRTDDCASEGDGLVDSRWEVHWVARLVSVQ